ncbi:MULTISPECIES: hypothetical protein [unclassified Spirillospora]|uniref:hypothetical protein n=1 Tax=unclassified Spirillospora TaxID=2642701 RepID=UPI003717FF81
MDDARLRLGVLDIGSNSAHLRIADLNPRQAPAPVRSVKSAVRLAEATDRHGIIHRPAVERLISAVREAAAAAAALDVEEMVRSPRPRCETPPTATKSPPRSTPPRASTSAFSPASRRHG